MCVFECCRYDHQLFPFLNMPAAMHLTVLVPLLALTVCIGATASSTTEQVKTTSAAQATTLTETQENDGGSTTVTSTKNTQQPSTSTHRITSATASVTSEKEPSSTPSISPQTPNRTEETHLTTLPQNTSTSQTLSQTVSYEPGSVSPNVTVANVNATSPDVSHGKGDLTQNPGLVAILCIFCIVFALVLVVIIVKCVRSPRPNFERLEDVPMGKVSEDSPFALYSK